MRRQVADSMARARDVHVRAGGHIGKALLAAGEEDSSPRRGNL